MTGASIDLISTAAGSRHPSGSGKVFWNLLKGLERIGHPYVVNRDPRSAARLWIHNDVFALRAAYRARRPTVIGPNLWILPRDIPRSLPFGDWLFLQPSEWATEVWRACGFAKCPIRTWAVGVDTDAFAPQTGGRRIGDVLVYHKARHPSGLDRILRELAGRGIGHVQITYGTYTEPEYRRALAQAPFVVWHGRHESQGLALQEALACDVPVVVCDVRSVADCFGEPYVFDACAVGVNATAAPYFDERCGVKIDDLDDLSAAIDRITNELDRYRPRDFVLERLSLEGQARAFVQLWDEIADTGPSPMQDVDLASTERPWRPSLLDVARLRLERRLHALRTRDHRPSRPH